MSNRCPFCHGEGYFRNLPVNIRVESNLAASLNDTDIKEHWRYICSACLGDGTSVTALSRLLSGDFKGFTLLEDKTSYRLNYES